MTDEKYRSSTLGKAAHFSEAFFLECGIANCEHLVDNQNFRLKVSGHGKSEADVHT